MIKAKGPVHYIKGNVPYTIRNIEFDGTNVDTIRMDVNPPFPRGEHFDGMDRTIIAYRAGFITHEQFHARLSVNSAPAEVYPLKDRSPAEVFQAAS